MSDGRIGSNLFGIKVLRLTTKGRRTGEPRAIMIYYFPYQDSQVIVASNAGADYHPAWYLNLQADPGAEIQLGRERRKVAGRTAEGEEREVLWSEIVARDSSFLSYQERTSRQFPVVILDPIDKNLD